MFPKMQNIHSEPYRRLVADLPCKHCGIHGYSQAAHPNTGKAMGKKLIDDRECFPLCSSRIGVEGCHAKFDQGALFPKYVRRSFELAWAADTRRQIIAANQWPKKLPMIERFEQ